MRLVAISLLLLTIVVPATSQPLTVLLLPPPLPPVNSDAQDAMVAALPVVWQKLMGKWAVVTFHKESPSIQRAKLEGKLPPDALTNPYEHADKLCAIEGTKVALWLRVTKAEDKTPQAIEARLLFPVDARFEVTSPKHLSRMKSGKFSAPFRPEHRQRPKWFSPSGSDSG